MSARILIAVMLVALVGLVGWTGHDLLTGDADAAPDGPGWEQLDRHTDVLCDGTTAVYRHWKGGLATVPNSERCGGPR